jgi:AraC family transcriptional regulator
MNGSHAARYSRRINKVLDYIHAHLDDELSVDTLSRVANFSRFHFHRQFSEYTGITVTRLVQLLRLRRASMQLVFNPRATVTEIGLKAGFANAESFSRAFRREHGLTPSAFRKNPQWAPWQMGAVADVKREPRLGPVEVVDFPELRVAALDHRGPRQKTYATMMTFLEWKRENFTKYQLGPAYGVYYTDPAITPPEDYHFVLCMPVNRPVEQNPQGVITSRIPAGRCARMRHVGAFHSSRGVDCLYRDWLPQSGEKLREFPLFCHFVKTALEVPEHEMVTDIYLPLK